jgi:SAM-dependent methyltransferase
VSICGEYFDELFANSDDPWAFRTRWYEHRKRDLTLALLPRQRYARIFEPGCANGELSLRLAERCDALLCMDMSARAVTLARERLSAHPHVEVLEGCLPEDWPAGAFDLVVISEWAYYLTPEAFAEIIERVRESLTPDGAVLACHWLHPIEGCPMDGRDVHQVLARHLAMERTVRHEERDFLLEMWSKDPRGIDLAEAVL